MWILASNSVSLAKIAKWNDAVWPEVDRHVIARFKTDRMRVPDCRRLQNAHDPLACCSVSQSWKKRVSKRPGRKWLVEGFVLILCSVAYGVLKPRVVTAKFAVLLSGSHGIEGECKALPNEYEVVNFPFIMLWNLPTICLLELQYYPLLPLVPTELRASPLDAAFAVLTLAVLTTQSKLAITFSAAPRGHQPTQTCSTETVTTSPAPKRLWWCILFCLVRRVVMYILNHLIQKRRPGNRLAPFHKDILRKHDWISRNHRGRSLGVEWMMLLEDTGTNGRLFGIVSPSASAVINVLRPFAWFTFTSAADHWANFSELLQCNLALCKALPDFSRFSLG